MRNLFCRIPYTGIRLWCHRIHFARYDSYNLVFASNWVRIGVPSVTIIGFLYNKTQSNEIVLQLNFSFK